MTGREITSHALHYIQYIDENHYMHHKHSCLLSFRFADFFGFPVLPVFLAICSILAISIVSATFWSSNLSFP